MDNPQRKWHQHPAVRAVAWVYAGLLVLQLAVVALTDHSDLLGWVASLTQ